MLGEVICCLHEALSPCNNCIILTSKTMFVLLLSWQNHCESLLGSFDERRTTLRPSDFALCAAIIYTQHHHLVLRNQKADSYFTIPRRVEGWVDLDTAASVWGCTLQWFCDSHTDCLQWDSVQESHAPQSGMLALDNCELVCTLLSCLCDRWWQRKSEHIRVRQLPSFKPWIPSQQSTLQRVYCSTGQGNKYCTI